MKTLFTLVTLFFCYTICWGQQKQLMVKMVNGKPQVVKVDSQLSVPFASTHNKKTISSQSVPYPARTQKFSNSTTNSAPQNSLLVKDINPNTVDVYAGSDPALYHNFNNNPSYPDTGVAIPGGSLFFPAYNYNGTELWQTDGTDAGTVITKDIASGGSYNDSYPMFLQAMGSDLFFFTAEYNFNNGGFTNYRLRKRDGTTGIINEGSLTDYPFDTVFNVMQANGYIFFLGIETNQYSYYFTNGKTALIKFDPSNNQYEIISTDSPTQMYAFDNYWFLMQMMA